MHICEEIKSKLIYVPSSLPLTYSGNKHNEQKMAIAEERTKERLFCHHFYFIGVVLLQLQCMTDMNEKDIKKNSFAIGMLVMKKRLVARQTNGYFLTLLLLLNNLT